ncbi:MAG: hypothetical protein WD749_09215 [Phycisphaerales bacterium]
MLPDFAGQAAGVLLMIALLAALTPLLNRGLARCPWCTYDLSGSPAQGGLTTCPECGGVWDKK